MKFAVLAMLAWCALLPIGSAHGLLARVRTDGNVIVGTAYYSSGERAGGEWVQFFDVAAQGTKVAEFSAGPDGSFRYEGIAGHRYRIAIHGDEGHSIELSIAIERGARARLVDDAIAGDESGITDLPAWLIVAAVLTLLSIVALVYRSREFVRVRGR